MPRQVRVCGAKRNNESPSGAFKRPNGLAQQDGGALPRQVRVCGANLPMGQAGQAHHATSKEKQSVPDGERPVVHIAVVCGFFRVRPIQGRTLFFCINGFVSLV